jgi:hypothetical protein
VCDDVSVNKSLYGNERDTPSIRSLLTAEVSAQLGEAVAQLVWYGMRLFMDGAGRRLADCGSCGPPTAGGLAGLRACACELFGLPVPGAPLALRAPPAPPGASGVVGSARIRADARPGNDIDVPLMSSWQHRCSIDVV